MGKLFVCLFVVWLILSFLSSVFKRVFVGS